MTYVIRRAVPADAEAIARNFSDPSAIAGTLQLPFPSVDVWRQRLAPADHSVQLVACTEGGELVGHAGLHLNALPRRAHAGSIGMTVPSPWQGKKVGTALLAAIVELADHWYGLARLELEVYTDNEAAIGLYRKFGFEIEGTHRAHALRRGQLADTYSMARLRARPQPPA